MSEVKAQSISESLQSELEFRNTIDENGLVMIRKFVGIRRLCKSSKNIINICK